MKISILAALAVLAPALVQAAEVPLSSLNLGVMKQGWGFPGINESVTSKPIQIGDRTFKSGVGTHASSHVKIQLHGAAKLFEATVGLDNAAKEEGSVVFIVIADDKKVYDSGVMERDTPAKEVKVPLAGVQTLTLKVTDAGDGRNNDHANWADAKIITDGAAPTTVAPVVEPKYILTPKPGPEPRINAPVVYGCKPGNEFLYRIPATGDRPMKYEAEGLPASLKLNPESGIITGVAPERGDHPVTLKASNVAGTSSKVFTIKSGDTLSLTPYMGWNHWYAHYHNITDKMMREAADAMVANGMVNYGYNYVAIDDCWMRKPGSEDPALQGDPRTSAGMIIPNKHFPDMKALTDYIHGKGLKAGTYTSPGPLTCGGYAGSFGYEAEDAKQFAEWGFDLVKYDWCSYGKEVAGKNPSLDAMIKPYRLMGDLLASQKRDIIFNLCQYGMGDVWEWGADVDGHSWRTAGDLGFSLDQIITVAAKNVEHRAWNGPGRWNDPDYLQIGFIGDIRNRSKLIPSPLTPTEQYSFMSLWCLMAAPLVYSGDITQLDEFTLNVLCNPEVIEVNQDPLGQCGAIADLGDGSYMLVKDMADGTKAVGLCNGGETTRTLKASWAAVGVVGPQVVRDLWRHKDLGTFDSEFESEVPRHGVTFVRLRKADASTQ